MSIVWNKETVNVKILEFCLGLSAPMYARIESRKLEQLYNESVKYGQTLASKYPLKNENIQSELINYGVSEIQTFQTLSLKNVSEKAYYDIDTKQIVWDDQFAITLFQKDDQAEELLGSVQKVEQALLIHEFFHFIEENFEMPTDEFVFPNCHTNIASIFREIAAFAFTNVELDNYICQFIDVLSLKINKPTQYNELCRQYLIREKETHI